MRVLGDRRLRRLGIMVFVSVASSPSACLDDAPTELRRPACGDAVLDEGEACDDGSVAGGDGCSACVVEPGFACEAGPPPRCAPICGDGTRSGAERCDDGNVSGGDGCTAECTVRRGWVCSVGRPDTCRVACGDGLVVDEACDDGNGADGDGCDVACQIERGFDCSPGEPSLCDAICGDGVVLGAEGCDDGNTAAGDGCGPTCAAANRWTPLPGRRGPAGRFAMVAVWTGSRVLIWGGASGQAAAPGGASYDPDLDIWLPLPEQSAPTGAVDSTAVWTGSEMIVWGGATEPPYGMTNTGGRYDPRTATWSPTSSDHALDGRARHTAVWTGTEMIIWGGGANGFSGRDARDDGARYHPAADRWTPTSSTFAPSARYGHTAVWTGSEMIVWGGRVLVGDTPLGDGARYDPAIDTWVPLPSLGAPSPRDAHSAVWTGREMIVFGGRGQDSDILGDGCIYDPQADAWRRLEEREAPSRRAHHSGVWTGDEMIVRGGMDADGPASGGGRFAPGVGRWSPLEGPGAPGGRVGEGAIWTGRKLFVWGGLSMAEPYWVDQSDLPPPRSDGAVYDAMARTWQPLDTGEGPPPLSNPDLAWTGDEMLVLGLEVGRAWVGARFRPSLNRWTEMNLEGVPSPRVDFSPVWTGTEWIVWGGRDEGLFGLGDGARYRPSDDTWTPMSSAYAPRGRSDYSAVWTGTEMLVFGGTSEDGEFSSEGGAYDPETDTWRPIAADRPRLLHSAVWTGSEMLVFGGIATYWEPWDTAGRYDPQTDTWETTARAPEGRFGHTATWTGRQMIVVGGDDDDDIREDPREALAYEPAFDRWVRLPGHDALPWIREHEALWTGREVIAVGGIWGDGRVLGGAYDPELARWRILPMENAPPVRARAGVVWTGSEVIVWGGLSTTPLGDGARLSF